MTTDDNVIAVDRAIAELRRGLLVLLGTDDEDYALALAAEQASLGSLAEICSWGKAGANGANRAVLVLTESRARALNIKPTGTGVVLLPVDQNTDVGLVQTLADGSTDLAQPFRGPFKRDRRPPLETEIAAVQLAKAARLLPSAVVVPITDKSSLYAAESKFLKVTTSQIFDF